MLLSSPSPSLRPPTTPSPFRFGSDPIRFSLSTTRTLSAHPLHLSSSTKQNSDAVLQRSQASYPILGFRREPQLGLASLLFVISMVMGSFILVAILSIPALGSFRKLAIFMDKLSKVVSEEVPGTLSSLKLSSLEINDLTNQLKFLRQKIPRNKYGREPRATPRPRCKPIIN